MSLTPTDTPASTTTTPEAVVPQWCQWIAVLFMVFIVIFVLCYFAKEFSRCRCRKGCFHSSRDETKEVAGPNEEINQSPDKGPSMPEPDANGITLQPLANRTGRSNRGAPHIRTKTRTSRSKGSISSGTSENWSGMVAGSNLNRVTRGSVTGVVGSFRVPTITRPSNGRAAYCSAWVGIDGYNNGTVQQIGIEADWDPVHNRPTYYAWTEFYPSPALEIVGLPINDNDLFTVSVTLTNSVTGQFRSVITNVTHNVSYTVPSRYTINRNAQCASAEWIVEAPYENGILPLAPYGTITWTACQANVNNVVGAITNSAWNAVKLSMVNSSNHVISQCNSIGVNSQTFSTTFI